MQPNASKETQLLEYIIDTYGTPETLDNWLDLAMEMLFYVEEDTLFPG